MSRYAEHLVSPMRAELTQAGFQELKTPEAVQKCIESKETVLLVINSVCGCAAANARPAAKLAIQQAKHVPQKWATVFAGMEQDAVAMARSYMAPYPPSSPAIALFKEGNLVHMTERHQIEGRSAELIAADLMDAFEHHCSDVASAS